MSELFDDEPGDVDTRRPGGRARALVITGVVLVVAFFALTTFASIYTDRLWYDEVGYGQVFSTMLWTRVGLFLVFGVFMGAAVAVNMYFAYRFRPLFRMPGGDGSVDRYRDAVTPIRTWLLAGVAIVVGIFAGTSALGQLAQLSALAARRAVPPEGPVLRQGHQLLRLQPAVVALRRRLRDGRRDRGDPGDGGRALPVRRHPAAGAARPAVGRGAGAVLGAARRVRAGQGRRLLPRPVRPGHRRPSALHGHELHRRERRASSAQHLDGRRVDLRGAVLPQHLAAHLAAAVGRPRVARPLRDPARHDLAGDRPELPGQADRGGQGRGVHPTKHRRHQEGVRHRGRRADTNIPARPDPTTPEPAALSNRSTGAGRRPQAGCETFEQRQQPQLYYSVAPVLDVDRYSIGNRRHRGGRERRWCSACASSIRPVSTTPTATGRTCTPSTPTARASSPPTPTRSRATRQRPDRVGRGHPGLRRTSCPTTSSRSRIYYGEQSPDYSVVGKSSEDAEDVELGLELDAADATEDGRRSRSRDDVRRRGRGRDRWHLPPADVRHEVRRAQLPAVRAGQRELEVLYNREPVTRVEKVAPWLTVDTDPYPAIVDGRIQWIVDGYTTTDRYPNSERESFESMIDDSLQADTGLQTVPTDEINYMRSAVKATVDAYDGTVNLYAWDEEDPILQTWMRRSPTRSSRRRTSRRVDGAPALSRGPVQGAALPARALPRDRRRRLLSGQRALGGPDRPRGRATASSRRTGCSPPTGRRQRVVAHLGLRAAWARQPGVVRLGQLGRRPPTTSGRSSCSR